MSDKNIYKGVNTICTHVGQVKDEQFGGSVSPIYPGTSYKYIDKEIDRYPRYSSTPNQEFLAKKISAEQQKQNKNITGGKFHIGKVGKSIAKTAKKLSGNEYAQDFTAGTVGLGVGAATGNPMTGVAAGTGTKIAMDKASGGKRGGGATRGKLVGKVMREKGLSD